MVEPGITDAATTDATTTDTAITDAVMLEGAVMPTDMRVTMAAAVTPEADTMVAEKFMVAEGIMAAEVVASTAEVNMVAGTGNSRNA